MLKDRFGKILVPLDGSLNSIRGLNEAISLARQSNGSITGIYVAASLVSGMSQMPKSYRARLEEESRKIMLHARTSAARHGLDFDGQVIMSSGIVKTITSYAKKNRFDIIVIGSRGKGSSDTRYIGSVANGVINTAQVPVLIVK